MSQEVDFGVAKFVFERGRREVMFSKAFEEASHVGGVGGGVRIVDDDVVKVSGDEFKAIVDLNNHLDEPAWGDTAALRHDDPLETSIRFVEGGEGNCILVDGDLIEGVAEDEQGRHASLPRESRIMSTRGVGSFSRKLIAFSVW